MRDCLSRTSSQTSPWASPRASGCAASVSALRRRRCGVRDVRRGAELVAQPAPAPLLDARDGDRQLRARADEDADVEDPVLLRADEFLAVVEQHRAVGRVLDEELGHRARGRRLRDPEPARQRLVERDVRRDRVAAGEERCDDDPAVLHGLAELEGVECHGRISFRREGVALQRSLPYGQPRFVPGAWLQPGTCLAPATMSLMDIL